MVSDRPPIRFAVTFDGHQPTKLNRPLINQQESQSEPTELYPNSIRA